MTQNEREFLTRKLNTYYKVFSEVYNDLSEEDNGDFASRWKNIALASALTPAILASSCSLGNNPYFPYKRNEPTKVEQTIDSMTQSIDPITGNVSYNKVDLPKGAYFRTSLGGNHESHTFIPKGSKLNIDTQVTSKKSTPYDRAAAVMGKDIKNTTIENKIGGEKSRKFDLIKQDPRLTDNAIELVEQGLAGRFPQK